MPLSDRDILAYVKDGRIKIEGLDTRDIQPCTVDVRLGPELLVLRHMDGCRIDLREDQSYLYRKVCLDPREPFWLPPGGCALGTVLERVTVPSDLRVTIEGLSSLGRSWLRLHVTAGFVDPGWDGHLTLELKNDAPLPISLFAGMQIGQLEFEPLSSPAEHPYAGHYKGDVGPAVSRYHLKERGFLKERA